MYVCFWICYFKFNVSFLACKCKFLLHVHVEHQTIKNFPFCRLPKNIVASLAIHFRNCKIKHAFNEFLLESKKFWNVTSSFLIDSSAVILMAQDIKIFLYSIAWKSYFFANSVKNFVDLNKRKTFWSCWRNC